MVIMYSLSYLTYFIMKSLVKLKYIGLVNLILGEKIGSRPIVKEYIQPSYSDQVDIMVELNKIDNDQNYRSKLTNDFKEIKDKLSTKPQYKLKDIAEIILKTNE